MNDNPDDSRDDLPPDMADMLRGVPPATDSVRDTHIGAALDAMGEPAGAKVLGFRGRTRVLTVAAAAIVVLVVGNALLGARTPKDVPAVALQPGDTSTEMVTTIPPTAKGDTGSGPHCTHGTLQVIDSVYVGEYVNQNDGHTYLVYTFNGTLEFVDKDTCRPLELVPATTTP